MEILSSIILFIQDAAPVVQSTAAAAAQSVQETATVVAMGSNASMIESKFFSAYVTVFILKYLRNQPWFPFLRDNAARMNKAVSIVAALAASQGIHWAFDIVAVDEATRQLNIAITFPTTVAMMHVLYGTATQYVMQQLNYKWFIVAHENQKTISEQIAEAVGKPAGVKPEPPGVVKD